jgi:hypothetical protein
MTTFAHASSKLGKVTGPTKSRAKEIFDAAQKAGHDVWFMWGYDGNANNTEHHSGRALDFMVRNKAAGDWIRNYIWTNRKRLRLQHVIWYQKITSTVTQPGVVRQMADRGSVTENHTDHVHALFFTGTYQKPGSENDPVDPTPEKKSLSEVAQDVRAGKYGNGYTRTQKLRSEGYDPAEVQREVNRQIAGDPPVRKTISQIASEVIAGKHGDGAARVEKLTRMGYNSNTVQKEVNRLLTPKGENKPKLTISQVATQVMRGDWGDGEVRKSRLTRAGYNYNAVQAEVNRRS